MGDYIVRYFKDGELHRSEFTTKGNARRIYNRLANEKILKTEWAELIYYPDDDTDILLESFERPTLNIMGHQVFMGTLKEGR